MKASGSPDTRSSRFGGGPGNLTGAPRRQAHPTEVHRTLSHPAVGDERVVDPQNLVDDRVQLGIRDARAQAGLQPGTAGQVVHQHSDAQRDGAEVAAGSVAQHRHDLGVGELAHNGAGLRDRLHRGSPRQGPHHYGHQMPAASGRWSRSQSRIGFRRRHYWRQRSVRQRPPQAVHARRHSRLSSGQLGIAVAEHRAGRRNSQLAATGTRLGGYDSGSRGRSVVGQPRRRAPTTAMCRASRWDGSAGSCPVSACTRASR
jgi:hypothetical protein